MIYKKSFKSFYLKYFLFAFTVLSCISTMAQGDLLIFPKRVVFDGTKKSQDLNLANNGKDTARYIISVVQIRMKEDGSFENITQPDSGQHFADKNIRFFPRNVVLGPNESQVVKIQLTNTSQINSGEYRSHIYFRAEPDRKPRGEEDESMDTASISVRLVPVFGISIPVIIRIGESNATVSLSDLSLVRIKDTMPALKLTFNRKGDMSVYGDVTVDHISPSGVKTKVASMQGLAVYTPNKARKALVMLDNTKGVNYHQGKLTVLYSKQPSERSAKMAEAELVLNEH
jgi:hypothetical protein